MRRELACGTSRPGGGWLGGSQLAWRGIKIGHQGFHDFRLMLASAEMRLEGRPQLDAFDGRKDQIDGLAGLRPRGFRRPRQPPRPGRRTIPAPNRRTAPRSPGPPGLAAPGEKLRGEHAVLFVQHAILDGQFHCPTQPPQRIGQLGDFRLDPLLVAAVVVAAGREHVSCFDL